MNILEIIEKKRDKKELTKEEIEFFINGYTNGEIADYQAAALVMAIFLNGMTKQETTNMTLSMANSGEILDLSKLNKNVKYLTVGNLAKEIGKELENNGFEAHYFNSNKDASCYILENLNKDNTIFLKASRSMQFEEILDNIRRGICKLW